MPTKTMPQTNRQTTRHAISVFHGASGTSMEVDLAPLKGFRGTVENALRRAISKNVFPGFFETLDAGDVEIELFSSGTGGEGPLERPLSRHEQWSTVLEEALASDVELGVARHARGGAGPMR
jgi:hypothetical protein